MRLFPHRWRVVPYDNTRDAYLAACAFCGKDACSAIERGAGDDYASWYACAEHSYTRMFGFVLPWSVW
jgi:hypothetical protein